MSEESIDENGQGLPETLPADEKVLWQGSPEWHKFTFQLFHIRKLAIYFLVILVIQAGYTISNGQTPTEVLTAAAGLASSALVAIGLFLLIGWMMSRAALYTITNKRLVMSVGAALSIDINIPFQQIDAAAVKLNSDGSGDIPLTVNKDQPVSYFLMWPHVRPWKFSKPEPMLRGISSAAEVAEILSQALQSDAGNIVQKGSIKAVRSETQVSTNSEGQAPLPA